MIDFTEAWATWRQFHNDHGFVIDQFLHPPATNTDLDAIEADIGFELPDDLRSLWRYADGQLNSIGIESTGTGTVISPVFGSYDFMPSASALAAYHQWLQIHEEHGTSMDDGITRREGNPVHAAYWIPGWLPFAIDGGGNSYAVDLSPAFGGTYGQVILIGPDEDERRVLAATIAEWLIETARRAPPLNNEAEAPLAYFDMEFGQAQTPAS